MTKTKMKTISTRVWHQSQSWHFTRILEVSGKKIQIRIERNAYDSQSCGKTLLWVNNGWNQITYVPIQFLECKKISYVNDKITDVTASDFEKDCKTLLDEALQII